MTLTAHQHDGSVRMWTTCRIMLTPASVVTVISWYMLSHRLVRKKIMAHIGASPGNQTPFKSKIGFIIEPWRRF